MQGKLVPLLISITLALTFASGCATTSDAPGPEPQAAVVPVTPPKEEITAKVAEELKELGESDVVEEKAEKPDKVTYDIPITVNSQVEYFINYFQTKVPKRFRLWMQRSGRYIPMMRAILKEYGLPEDLVYLAMIESGFNCNAYSRAAAVGPWQFIKGTGRRYGLRINYWVDERRDPVKATHAAAQYLRDLYAEFGSWYLAAAAYNAGEGKVRRALKRYNAEDFWAISKHRRRYLKRETKQYVPKMIAAALIAKEPAKYGFQDMTYDEPLSFDTVQVHPGTSLGVAAKLAGVSTKQLSALNPELRRWCTPPTGSYTLRVPAGNRASFETAYAALPPSKRKARIGAITVRVQRGDTLGSIARTHRVSLHDLMSMNQHLNPRCLQIGQKVMVPPSHYTSSRTGEVASSAEVRTYPAARKGARKIIHVVRPGDTLWDIAQTYDLNWRSIRSWNGARASSLSVGSKLVLYVPASKAEAKVAKVAEPPKVSTSGGKLVHVVRRGDTMWDIAQSYGVTTSQLKGWNHKRSSRLSVGDKLVIYSGGKASGGSLAMASAPNSVVTYQVRRGDNLWEISRRFGCSPADLRRWNGLSSSRLDPGDQLIVRVKQQ